MFAVDISAIARHYLPVATTSLGLAGLIATTTFSLTPTRARKIVKSLDSSEYSKISDKPLRQQIEVVAEFHAHKIAAERIAIRTGVKLELVLELTRGEAHQPLFKRLLASHRRRRRDTQISQSRRTKGIAQASLQDKIEQEYKTTLAEARLQAN